MQTKTSPMVMGLTSEDWQQFDELLIKANDHQIRMMAFQIISQEIRRGIR